MITPQHAAAEMIRERILTGEWQPGAILPSRTVLAAELDSSAYAISAALHLVAADGLIMVKPRSGVVVTHSRIVPAPRDRLTRYLKSSRILPEDGYSAWLGSAPILISRDDPGPFTPHGRDLAALFGAEVAIGTRTRVTYDGAGQPVSYSTSYRYADLIDAEAWYGEGRMLNAGLPYAEGTLSERYDAAGHITSGTDQFSTRAAREAEARMLGCAPGSSLLASSNLWTWTTSNGAHPTIIEYGESLYAPGVKIAHSYAS